MIMVKCHSDAKGVEGFRFKVGSVWGLLVDPLKDDKFVALSQIEKTETGSKLKQEIISVEKLKKMLLEDHVKMCVRICECLRCGQKRRCRNCTWIGAALAQMTKHGADITASVMCRTGNGVQWCPGFKQKGGRQN